MLYVLGEKLSADAADAENPRLATEGAVSWCNAMLDMPCRPSRASRRSFTPTPLFERLRLWRERFEMCMRPGEILRRGLTLPDLQPLPRSMFSTAGLRVLASFPAQNVNAYKLATHVLGTMQRSASPSILLRPVR